MLQTLKVSSLLKTSYLLKYFWYIIVILIKVVVIYDMLKNSPYLLGDFIQKPN